jgi:hypothetical protein
MQGQSVKAPHALDPNLQICGPISGYGDRLERASHQILLNASQSSAEFVARVTKRKIVIKQKF